MISSQWYQGATYPINLEKCSKARHCVSHKVKSLASLSAAFIVKDSTVTLQAIEILPKELCLVLLKEALLDNRDRAIDVLLSRWPAQVLKLRNFAPDIFTSLRLLYDHEELTKVAKQGLRYTTCVAHNFMEALKKNSHNKLRFLDMTGYPTAEVITAYLATHCMLAFNEARQSVMIKKYEAAVKQLSEVEQQEHDSIQQFTADQSIREDFFVVKFDAFLTSQNALMELCKALKVSSFESCTLRLIIEKLDATCLGEPKIKILLEQVNTEHLKSLRLKYNSLSSADLISLTPAILPFTQLTCLDLSCNSINLFHSHHSADAMRQLFTSLPLLHRLDLSNIRLKTKLRHILSVLNTPLTYLRLAGCGLNQVDVSYLASSHHAQSIQELDISENSLGAYVNVLVVLLQKIQSQIRVLEMEDSMLIDLPVNTLIASGSFCQLSQLMYLNISENRCNSQALLELGRSLVNLRELQYLCVSYPLECYLHETEEEVDVSKSGFFHCIADTMAHNGKQTEVTFVLSDLKVATHIV